MKITALKIVAAAVIFTPALLIGTAPVFAATPKTAKAKPPVLTCKITTPEGLSYTVIKTGKGDKPAATAEVKVNYKGYLQWNGSEFDAGSNSEFNVGGVISGFSQGLQLMQPGGKIRLCIPAKLGYGETGTGPIPANADLVFEVELLSFTAPPPKPVMPLTERSCAQTTASGLGYATIKAGSGKTPTDTDIALVDFTTFDAESGSILEVRQWEKITLTQATAVFSEALKSMQIGGASTFCLPRQTDARAGDPQINIRVDLLDLRTAPATK